jgi:hypothetical protein
MATFGDKFYHLELVHKKRVDRARKRFLILQIENPSTQDYFEFTVLENLRLMIVLEFRYCIEKHISSGTGEEKNKDLLYSLYIPTFNPLILQEEWTVQGERIYKKNLEKLNHMSHESKNILGSLITAFIEERVPPPANPSAKLIYTKKKLYPLILQLKKIEQSKLPALIRNLTTIFSHVKGSDLLNCEKFYWEVEYFRENDSQLNNILSEIGNIQKSLNLM